jgi:hypothetical protein
VVFAVSDAADGDLKDLPGLSATLCKLVVINILNTRKPAGPVICSKSKDNALLATTVDFARWLLA